MHKSIIWAAFAAFFLAGTAHAVPVIFKSGNGILVRSPSGVVVSKPSIGELLQTVPTPASDAVAMGRYQAAIGKTPFDIPATKTYAAADIAAAAASAILSKAPVAGSLIAGLALPYVIDMVTGTVTKSIPGTTSPAVDTLAPVPPTGSVYITNYAWQYLDQFLANNKAAGDPTPGCADNVYYCLYKQQYIGQAPYVYVYGYPKTSGTPCANGQYQDAYCVNQCTAPSTYDPATEMCLGSPFNEPANAAQLQADIEETFYGDNTTAKEAFDHLIQNDIEPASSQPEQLGEPTPNAIPGGTETTTRQYHDPATGHPVSETAETTKTYKVEKAGDTTYNVKVESQTVTNITDQVTNNTTTNTTTNIQNPDPTEQDDQGEFVPPPLAELDTTIEAPEKTPLDPVLDDMKSDIDTWSSGIGIQAQAGNCSITDTWEIGGASHDTSISFCEFESQIEALGLIVLSFAMVYGGFIIMGVR